MFKRHSTSYLLEEKKWWWGTIMHTQQVHLDGFHSMNEESLHGDQKKKNSYLMTITWMLDDDQYNGQMKPAICTQHKP